MGLRATRHAWGRQVINARNEGVRGSNPRVGFPQPSRFSHLGFLRPRRVVSGLVSTPTVIAGCAPRCAPAPPEPRSSDVRRSWGRGVDSRKPQTSECTAHRRFRSRLSSTVTGTLVPERSSLPWRFPGGNGGHKRAVVGCLERLLGTDAHPRIARVAPAQEAARRRRGPLRRQRLGGC